MPSRSLRCCPTFPRQLKSSRVLSPAYARSTAILSTCAAELGPLEFVDANTGVRNATRKTRGCYALRSLVWQSPCVKSCASPSDDATAGRCALGTTSRTFDVFLQTRPSDVVCSRQAQRVCLLFAISSRSWARQRHTRGTRLFPCMCLAKDHLLHPCLQRPVNLMAATTR